MHAGSSSSDRLLWTCPAANLGTVHPKMGIAPDDRYGVST